jgi:hypothetical protein
LFEFDDAFPPEPKSLLLNSLEFLKEKPALVPLTLPMLSFFLKRGVAVF